MIRLLANTPFQTEDSPSQMKIIIPEMLLFLDWEISRTDDAQTYIISATSRSSRNCRNAISRAMRAGTCKIDIDIPRVLIS